MLVRNKTAVNLDCTIRKYLVWVGGNLPLFSNLIITLETFQICRLSLKCGEIAQMVQRWATEWEVLGSNPIGGWFEISWSTWLGLSCSSLADAMLNRTTLDGVYLIPTKRGKIDDQCTWPTIMQIVRQQIHLVDAIP